MARFGWFAFALLVVGVAVLSVTESPWVSVVLYGFWFLVLAGFVARAVRFARSGSAVARTLAPATDATEDVQGFLLGRGPRAPVGYGQDQAIVATAEVDFSDPFSQPVWTITPGQRTRPPSS